MRGILSQFDSQKTTGSHSSWEVYNIGTKETVKDGLRFEEAKELADKLTNEEDTVTIPDGECIDAQGNVYDVKEKAEKTLL